MAASRKVERIKFVGCIGAILAALVIAIVGDSAAGRGVLAEAADAPANGDSAATVTLYDDDPQHLCNRLHAALLVRRLPRGKFVGHDELDPLLWHDTKHLIEGNSYEAAVRLLDEVLVCDLDKTLPDPLQRAVLQHDLWFVFDWLAARDDSANRRTLARRLAAALRKLALNAREIESLPNTFQRAVAAKELPPSFDAEHPQRPFLPADLFDADGPWVGLSRTGTDDRFAARLHVQMFGARSVFLVFLRLPGAAKQRSNI
jgi:hypothetical protein